MRNSIFRTLLCSLMLLGAWLCVQPNAAQAIVQEPEPGLWWYPSQGSNALDFQRDAYDRYTLTWFTFQTNGAPVWYVSDTNGVYYGRWVSTLYRSHWNSVTNTNTLVNIGTVRFDFTSETEALFTWDFNSAAGAGAGADGSTNVELNRGGGNYTGLWYETTLPGWGVSVAHQITIGFDTVVHVSFYDGSLPSWAQTTYATSPSGFNPTGLTRYTSTSQCPSCSGSGSVTTSSVGLIYLDLGSWTGTAATSITLPSGNTWNRGTPYYGVNMQRLTYP